MTVAEIEARWASAQKGPWMWDVNMACHQAHLTTAHSGRIFILGFQRWGMQWAQPMFQDYKKGIVEPLKRWAKARFAHHPDFDMFIDHPDAIAIAAAPDDIHFLVSEHKHLSQKNIELTAQLHAEAEENCRLRREISELRRGEGRAE